jgi:glycosyltransferase involved in cell wall biosynthesis
MIKLPISVCIIAKNEESHIEECLKRLKPYNMELVVTDTGSTDMTRDIALKYADKVLDFAWVNDVSAARNYCAANASNDWIFALVCDEYAETLDSKLLLEWITHFPKNLGLLHLKSLVIHPNGEKGYVTDDIPRLYNRKYYRFENQVHEQIKPMGNLDLPSFQIPMEATHYGYALTKEENEKKQQRNLAILKSQLDKGGDDPYMYFQVGQSEMVLNNYESAITYYEKALSLNPPRNLSYVQYLIEGLAKAYVCVNRRSDALALMDKYEQECDSPRYVFYHANVLLDNNEPLKALVKYVKVTTMPETDPISNELMYSYRRIIEIYHKFGEADLAKFFEEKYAECLEARKAQ